MMIHSIVGEIESILKGEGCRYARYEHAPVRTSTEAAQVRPDFSLAQGTKALVVRTRGRGEKHFAMLVVPGDRRFDVKKAREALESNDIRFAAEEEVRDVTGGVELGGVPPWGNLFDFPVFVDKSIFVHETIIFSAGDKKVSIAMKAADYKRLVKPNVVDLV